MKTGFNFKVVQVPQLHDQVHDRHFRRVAVATDDPGNDMVSLATGRRVFRWDGS